MPEPLTERYKSLSHNRITRPRARSFKDEVTERQWNSHDFRDVAGVSPLPEHSFKKSIRNLNFWPSSYTNRVYRTPHIGYEPSFTQSKNSAIITPKDYKIVLRSKNQIAKRSMMASKIARESIIQKQSNFATPINQSELESNQRRSIDLSTRPIQSSKYANDTLFKELNTKIVSKIVAQRIAEKAKRNGTSHKPLSLPTVQRELESFVGNFTILSNKIETSTFNYEKIQKAVKKVLFQPSNEQFSNQQNGLVHQESSRKPLSPIKPRKIAETILKFDSSIQELMARKENIKKLKTEFSNIEGEIGNCSRAFLALINKEVE